VPVALLNTDEIQPTGTLIPKIKRVRMRFGAPLDFSRYASARGDRFVERAITDEIMYELMTLSGRPYVDVYAAKLKAEPAGLAPLGAHSAP
jgi:1-acyl-sn-glycerol-3-phosphate acyltransferase